MRLSVQKKVKSGGLYTSENGVHEVNVSENFEFLLELRYQ